VRDRSYSNPLIALFLTIAVSGLLGVACGGSSNQGNKNTTLDTPSPSPTPDPCADGTIVDMIYSKFLKDPDIFPKIKQINVYATGGAVTVVGWVDTPAKMAKVIDIAKNTNKCVKSVDSSKFYGCAPGSPVQPDNVGGCGNWVRCGDICVPPDHCFWNEAPPPGTTPSPVPTPSGATSCSPTPTPTPGTNSNSTPNDTNTKSNLNSNTKY
jgi:hypothetical protein